MQVMENILNEYLKSVYNYAYRIAGNKNDAEDITQETFIKIWKNFKKINENKNLKAWIFAIARNTIIDHLRKRKNISFSQLDEQDNEDEKNYFSENIADVEPLPDEIFERKELKEELKEALAKIRPDFREIILLHYVEDLTFEEIAKIVEKPLNTVKSHHRRSLSEIRKLLLL
jgi:RNA polymerase sigma-70 factor (ECF subfamily)